MNGKQFITEAFVVASVLSVGYFMMSALTERVQFADLWFLVLLCTMATAIIVGLKCKSDRQ